MASIFKMTGTGKEDGVYTTDFYNDITKSFVATKDVTFSGGAADVVLDVAAGVACHSLDKGANPPATGMCYVTSTIEQILEGLQIDGVINLVVVGASIMELTYANEEARADGSTQLYKNGVYAKIYERATSGDTTAEILEDLPAVLAEFAGQEANTFICPHGGGNDISDAGAYPAAAATLAANYRQILEDIIAAGFHAVGTSISDRVAPYPTDIEPYNTNVIEPLIQELTPLFWNEETSRPVIDMWEISNQYSDTGFIDDGIHPNDIGKALNRIGIAEGFATKVNQINAPLGGIQDLVLTIGSRDNPDIPNWLDGNQYFPSVFMPVNVDGNDAISAFLSTEISGDSADNGRGNAGDTSQSLTNDLLLSSYMYDATDEGKEITVDVGYGQYEDTFTVSCTASRIASSDAYTEVTIGGVTKVLNTAAIIPEIITFTGVTGQQLLDAGIKWNRQTGTSTAYFSGARVTKE